MLCRSPRVSKGVTFKLAYYALAYARASASKNLKSNNRSAPGHAPAKRGQQHEASLFYLAGLDTFIYRNRDRCRRSIAHLGDIRVNLFLRHAETRRNRIRNTLICLMRNNDIDVIDSIASLLDHFGRNIRHRTHRYLEKLVP